MTRARNCFLVVAIAAVGLACGSDGGSSTGTGGSGGSGGPGAAGSHGGAGSSGAAGTTGVAGVSGHAGSGGGAGAGAGTGGHAGSGGSGGAGGGQAGAGGGAGAGAGAGGHAGSGGSGAGGGGQAGSGGGAGAGGQAGSAGGAGGSGNVCGGIAGVTCALGQFCAFSNHQCGAGDQQGQCELSGGAVCPQQIVCGCDGKTYSTACAAHTNGVDTTSTTSCIPGNGGTGAPCGVDTDCMTGFKCCVSGGAVGSPIACRQIPSGGSCPLLP